MLFLPRHVYSNAAKNKWSRNKLDFITLIFVNNTNPLQGRLAVGYIYVVSDWILGMLGKIFKYSRTEWTSVQGFFGESKLVLFHLLSVSQSVDSLFSCILKFMVPRERLDKRNCFPMFCSEHFLKTKLNPRWTKKPWNWS